MITIDRFEDDKAILETDKTFLVTDRNKLPGNAKIGDILSFVNGAFYIDKKTTEERRESMKKRLDRLIKKND